VFICNPELSKMIPTSLHENTILSSIPSSPKLWNLTESYCPSVLRNLDDENKSQPFVKVHKAQTEGRRYGSTPALKFFGKAVFLLEQKIKGEWVPVDYKTSDYKAHMKLIKGKKSTE